MKIVRLKDNFNLKYKFKNFDFGDYYFNDKSENASIVILIESEHNGYILIPCDLVYIMHVDGYCVDNVGKGTEVEIDYVGIEFVSIEDQGTVRDNHGKEISIEAACELLKVDKKTIINTLNKAMNDIDSMTDYLNHALRLYWDFYFEYTIKDYIYEREH